MTAKRKSYPTYKSSNIEWLGDMPAHWEVDRLKWTVAMCRNGIWGDEPDGVNDVVCVRVADFDRTRFVVQLEKPTLRAVAESQRNGRMLDNGDLLLEKSGGGELQPVGAVVLFDQDVESVCSNFVARMPVTTGFNGRFLAYFHAHLYSGRVNTRSIKQTTGIQNLDSESYLNEHIPFIPLDEQRAIAAFLDRETAKIDELFAKKRRLIELLAEKRTALISHAVTKGLDPNAEMKDSGVEWMSHIPKHWIMPRVRFVSRSYAGGTPDRNTPEFWGGDIPWVTTGEVKYSDISSTQQHITSDGLLRSAATIAPAGTLLIALYGEGVTRGRVAILRVDAAFNQACLAVDFDRRIMPEFAQFWFISAYDEIRTLGKSNTQPNLSGDIVRGLRLPMPPLSEQRLIVDMLGHYLAELDPLLLKIEDGIQYLREYRSALISAAVTGEIDVRRDA